MHLGRKKSQRRLPLQSSVSCIILQCFNPIYTSLPKLRKGAHIFDLLWLRIISLVVSTITLRVHVCCSWLTEKVCVMLFTIYWRWAYWGRACFEDIMLRKRYFLDLYCCFIRLDSLESPRIISVSSKPPPPGQASDARSLDSTTWA